MVRSVTLVAVLVTLLGCADSGSSQLGGDAAPENDVISVRKDDAEMEAAMQTARDQFSDFWQAVTTDAQRAVPMVSAPMLKVYFFDEDAPEDGEHMWVQEIDYDGETVSGVLVSTPQQVRSVQAGQTVQFPLERLSDWLYAEEGVVVGAFTVKLLRSRMTDAERQQHDSHYPFRFE